MTAGILTLSKHDSGANPASYLSLLVNFQPKLAECNHANDYYSSHTVSYIGCTDENITSQLFCLLAYVVLCAS